MERTQGINKNTVSSTTLHEAQAWKFKCIQGGLDGKVEIIDLSSQSASHQIAV